MKREASASLGLGCNVAVVALREDGQAPEEQLGGLQVIRLEGKRSRGGPGAYLAEYGAFTWRCRKLLATDPRLAAVRLVQVHTLPDFLIWAATPAQRRGARVVLDLHEIFPEFSASKYPGLPGRAVALVARVIERAARRKADLTITVNRPIDALLSERGIGRAEKRMIVHNSTDPEDFGPPRAPTASASGSRLELVYHGTLTPLYGLDLAVRGAAIAAAQGVKLRLTIIGSGSQLEALRRQVADQALESLVVFDAPLPQDQLRARLAGFDAGVVPTRLNGMTRYSLSNKLLEYLHLGLPVLAARLPSYQSYLAEDSAWYWTPNDSHDFARAIVAFAGADATERLERAQRGQARLEDCLAHRADTLAGGLP